MRQAHEPHSASKLKLVHNSTSSSRFLCAFVQMRFDLRHSFPLLTTKVHAATSLCHGGRHLSFPVPVAYCSLLCCVLPLASPSAPLTALLLIGACCVRSVSSGAGWWRSSCGLWLAPRMLM